MEVYAIEIVDFGVYQSVFPTNQAHFSQLHSTIEDAVAYIHEIAGAVEIKFPEELK